jgi:DNA-binding GntR family transcriptional regulator
MPTLPKAALAYRTKQELVYQRLRESIMRCELRPGTRILIDDLARRLGVSAIPVREALNALRSEGLVVNEPHVGATVAPIAPASVREIFAIMEGLEIVATREAARHLDAEKLAELEATLQAMDEALAASDYGRWSEMNSDFHLAISSMTAMPLLFEMTERALRRWDRMRRHFFEGVLVPRADMAQREHHELLAAMKAGDLPRLETLVRLHNQGAMLDYDEFIRRSEKDGRDSRG